MLVTLHAAPPACHNLLVNTANLIHSLEPHLLPSMQQTLLQTEAMRHFCRLYLQTKLANPHYKPEIAAQTTLVNFCVTEVGLEEQLLAQVVDHERPDLQEQARSLVRQLGEYTITLKELEDNLLQRLANSQVPPVASHGVFCLVVIGLFYTAYFNDRQPQHTDALCCIISACCLPLVSQKDMIVHYTSDCAWRERYSAIQALISVDASHQPFEEMA